MAKLGAEDRRGGHARTAYIFIYKKYKYKYKHVFDIYIHIYLFIYLYIYVFIYTVLSICIYALRVRSKKKVLCIIHGWAGGAGGHGGGRWWSECSQTGCPKRTGRGKEYHSESMKTNEIILYIHIHI